MKKIIFTNDFLSHSKKDKILWIFKTFLPMIKASTTDDVVIAMDLTDKNNNLFSQKKFFEYAGTSKIKTSYQLYKPEEFNEKQIRYLKQFFNEDTIVIGFELYGTMVDLLTSLNTKVIDIAIHPYKLFDDLAFGFSSNDKCIYNNLLKYKISQNQFYYFANYWKVFMEYNGLVNDNDLADNSVLFVGQTLIDKSVEKDGKFLNVIDFEEKLKELSQNYSKIYYLPHPYLGKKRKLIYDWVKNSPYIELLTNRSTYGLLASDKIKKVVGISTSVLYEAQYFDKEIEYLYKPLFNVDVPFEEHSYISIFEDYWNPKFWADILAPVCDVKNNVPDINYFKGSSNKLRNIDNAYWGYAELDPIKRIPNFEQSLRRSYLKYIAPLF